MKINSHNEWDTLREIIVGNAETVAGLILAGIDELSDTKRCEKALKLAKEAFPQWMIDEINEDLRELCNVLTKFGAKVLRPPSADIHKFFATPNWAALGHNIFNARDLYLVVGNTVIESPSPVKYRYFEATGYYDIWYNQYFKEGFRWIAGPKPRLTGQYQIPFFENGKRYTKLAESEILFDAACTVRMGRDLLYLVSSTGNYLGAQWLSSVLGDEYQVHTTETIYRAAHIDSTVMPLRPGLVLLNAYRVNENNCPPLFAKWEKIWFEEIVPTPEETLKFHNTTRKKIHEELAEMGIQSNLRDISSDWIGMNFLSLDPETVIVDKRQIALIKLLEKHKFTVIPVSDRHSYFMGGIHCNTLDTIRDSKLESYFG